MAPVRRGPEAFASDGSGVLPITGSFSVGAIIRARANVGDGFSGLKALGVEIVFVVDDTESGVTVLAVTGRAATLDSVAEVEGIVLAVDPVDEGRSVRPPSENAGLSGVFVIAPARAEGW